jgi:hypothetical protein
MSSQVAYRLGDGAPVTMDAARAIWAAVAREVLDAAVTTSVTHSELARQVQQRSGVYTRTPAVEWLPAVVAAGGGAPRTARRGAAAPPAPPPPRTAAPKPARAEPAPRKRVEAPVAICPTCFMQLPASGRCDTCA